MTPISTLIVDDHRLFAEALRLRLGREPDLQPVRSAISASEALTLAHADPPDVVILDDRLGTDDGVDLVSRMRDAASGCRVVMLSGFEQAGAVVRALRSGACGWMAKTAGIEELLCAIRGVTRGDAWLSPQLLGSILPELLSDRSTATDDRLSALTAREREVLACLVEGLSRAQIAAQLYMSANTARTHTQNLLAKLDAHSTLEAVSIALHHGMRMTGTGR
jgi:DNA-binding NarL/FixJ family response regulator